MASEQSDDEEPFVIEEEKAACASEVGTSNLSILEHLSNVMKSIYQSDLGPSTSKIDGNSDINRPVNRSDTGSAVNRSDTGSEVCRKSMDSKHSLAIHTLWDTNDQNDPRRNTNNSNEIGLKKDIKNLQCDKCDVRCKNSYLLGIHRGSHSDERPYVCSICTRAFKRAYYLQRHETKHGGLDHELNDLPSQSSQADSEATESSCISVHNTATDGSANMPSPSFNVSAAEHWNCLFCKKEFHTQHALLRHENSHRGRKFTCDKCGLLCMNGYVLKGHMRLHLEETSAANSIEDEDALFDLSSVVDGELHRNDADVSEADTVDTETDIDTEANGVANSNQKSTARSRNYKAFECSMCGKMLSSRSSLRAHSLIHRGSKPFKCSDCEQSFLRNQDLTKHLLKYHSKPLKMRSCTLCEFQTKHESLWKRHQLKHTDIRSVPCCECGQLFKSKAGMRKHKTAAHKELPAPLQNLPLPTTSSGVYAQGLMLTVQFPKSLLVRSLKGSCEHMCLTTFIATCSYGSLEMPIIWIEDFELDVMHTIAHQSVAAIVCVRSLDLTKNSTRNWLSGMRNCDATSNIVWCQEKEEEVYMFLLRSGKFGNDMKRQKFQSYSQLSLLVNDYGRSIQKIPVNIVRYSADDWYRGLDGPLAITTVW